MKQGGNNFAFIDSQNLNLNIRKEGWIIDLKKFFIYLNEKYQVSKAFLFIGYIKNNQQLYNFLKLCGYKIIFKPTGHTALGETKGNVDAELVLHTMIQFNNFDQAIIVTGDGDFYCLVEYLQQHNKFGNLLAPNTQSCSSLLKNTCVDRINFVSNLKNRLEYKKSR